MAMKKTSSINEEISSISSTPEPVKPPLVKSQTEASIALSTTSTVTPDPEPLTFDIEHMPVKNDPRSWSPLRKAPLISSAAMVAALAANIQNPAVQQMEADLPATSSQFSLSISLFILTQGLMPLIWSAVSEVKGRKLVYILSLALFTLGSLIVALSQHIGTVIGFRCLQAAGSSAVMSIGAATLADIFEPSERGAKMGVYYVAPLLGPALGPIAGGVLTSVWNWRAIFWFLSIVCGTTLLCFILFFHDTFRCERSLTYQKVLKQRLRASTLLPLAYPNKSSTVGKGCLQANKSDIDIEKVAAKSTVEEVQREAIAAALPTVHLSVKDVNPFKPLFQVLRRMNNLLVLLSSGLLYSYGFVVLYATSITLSSQYGYNPLKIGLVAIAFGAGSVAGSVLGGRWSDRQLRRLRAANGGKGSPEMRLQSTIIGMIFLPPSVLGLGWIYKSHLSVAVICLFLFLGGFFWIWIYSSSLAYVVDANIGRSSTAVAGNSAFRGIFAFMAIEVAVPLQDVLGDGWMYTVWAGVVSLGCLCILLVWWKGEQWRLEAEMREAEHTKRLDEATFSTNKFVPGNP
ncbi:major facilitator superfamily domain-containing protein [Flammula alnicola]|nr:major facilitator superfamily domain-containing protein [Flammula alnicola]